MGFMNRLRPATQPDVSNNVIRPSSSQVPERNAPSATVNVNTEKGVETTSPEAQNDWVKVSEASVPAEDAQYGIKKIEAVTLTWSKKSLAALLCK
jgi:hypothetical protein